MINPADWQQIELARGVAEVGEPMSLAVLPDRSVLHTARNGTLRRTDVNGTTSVVANIAVYTHDEEGLQGIAVDPNFASNRFIYLYYAPPLSTPGGDAPASGTAAQFAPFNGVNRLSRFTLNTNFTLSGEATILEVATNRGMCCHVGGDLDFDAAGNLYLSTGDDSNPFESNGYAPIDERTDRNPAYDAQRSAANTNDLRGKVLRIKPNATGGGYTVPAGNLFAPGTANTRPEIYAMGFRNPFRMSVDKATGVVYLGDYGPDSGSTDANRGPSGQVEFDRIASPGNYGWPYCTGTNTTTETYNEWNFATNSTGPKYNCSGGPTNNSFRNTGQPTLPAARPAWIRYAGATSFIARVSSGGPGGTLSLRAGSATGTLLGSVAVPNTGSFDTFTTVTGTLSNIPAGATTLYLVFTGGTGALFDVDWFDIASGTTPAPNLALNKTATASSSCNANEGPPKAVNGTVNGGNSDKWCALGTTKWWQVDLGSSTSVSRFVVRHAGAGGENTAWNTRDFDIQVSTNGTTWTTVSQVRGNTANVSTHTIAATQARYVRMNVLVPTNNTDTAARVYEFEAYAS